jgi:hypothetical protein
MRIFSLEAANETLQAVRPLAETLVATAERLRLCRVRVAELGGHVSGNGAGRGQASALGEAEREAAELMREVSDVVEQIEELGVLVKDIDIGLVDFPTRRGDETVLLCWKVGEDGIRFWHGLEEGYAGRKPLPL